jgi:phosphopentomutase
MARAFVLVLDSVGIGAAPDADRYGDQGADTVGHIAIACAAGQADRGRLGSGALRIPNLVRLGLGEACALASGHIPPGLETNAANEGFHACAVEISRGKDTPSGHWEIAGLPVLEDWHMFPETIPAFAPELLDALCREANLRGTLGNCHASGTTILESLGGEHMRTGQPICYTSADSVFQIAAHEGTFGLERLYRVCEIARGLLDPVRVGRVIARPFVGDERTGFVRTGNRRDYTMAPQGETILTRAARDGREIVSIGKIADIFAHHDTGRVVHAFGNSETMTSVSECVSSLRDGGLMLANFNDFDTLFGHRRDVAGYAAALEQFDAGLDHVRSSLRRGDIVIITADHGCDPTWKGTDHTREHVPIIAFGPDVPCGSGGVRQTFADVAATLSAHLGLHPTTGTPLWR